MTIALLSRCALAVILCVAFPRTSGAQQDPPDELPPDAQWIGRDLVFTVEDINRLTETEKEICLGLTADVLFDFVSAELKPAAIPSLERAAALIREEAVGDVRVEGTPTPRARTTTSRSCQSVSRPPSATGWRPTTGSRRRRS